MMNFLVDPNGQMVDTSLTLLALLADNLEGKAAIAHSKLVPQLWR
jgi:hypothetical protein